MTMFRVAEGVLGIDVETVDAVIERLSRLGADQIVFPDFGVWPGDPAVAFERVRTELHRFDDRVLELHEATSWREETRQSVARTLLDITPEYDPAVEGFLSWLVTNGYLRTNGVQ